MTAAPAAGGLLAPDVAELAGQLDRARNTAVALECQLAAVTSALRNVLDVEPGHGGRAHTQARDLLTRIDEGSTQPQPDPLVELAETMAGLIAICGLHESVEAFVEETRDQVERDLITRARQLGLDVPAVEPPQVVTIQPTSGVL